MDRDPPQAAIAYMRHAFGASAEVVSLRLQYRSNFDLQAKRTGEERIAHGIAIAKGHDNLAALLARVNCASQIQGRLGEEIYPITASPSMDSGSVDPAGPPEKHASVAAASTILNALVHSFADACE